MAQPLRVVHFINAFYGGMGGEEAAHTPVQIQDGVAGPGRLLAQRLGDQAEVVATIICGDGYFSEHEDDVADWVMARLQTLRADVFIAGPAFRSGRYGLSCGRLCLEAERAGIPAVDIIDLEYPDASMRYWHTAEDTLDKVSPHGLQVVGDVLLAALPAIELRIR